MSKLSNREKRILTFIVTNCEIYHLNEKEAMKYINYNSSRPISRRTYYNYKNRIYKEQEKNSSYFALLKTGNPEICRKMTSLLFSSSRDVMVEEALQDNIRLEEFDKLNLIPQYLKDLQARTENAIEHPEILDESESERRFLNRNDLPIPGKATIREEYIKCGKLFCYGCPHGPYYYAYWKDENRKLKKKYLGINKPRAAQEKSNNSVLTLLRKGKRDNSVLTLLRKGKRDNSVLTLLRKQKPDNNLLNLLRKQGEKGKRYDSNNMFRAQIRTFPFRRALL